jgi:hypothetical protein
VDLKEVNGDYVVVEVNDNPSIYAGYEDSVDKDIYQKNHQLLSTVPQLSFATYLSSVFSSMQC